MNVNDFEKLELRQNIYWNNECYTLVKKEEVVSISHFPFRRVTLLKDKKERTFFWASICEECSLTPPKKEDDLQFIEINGKTFRLTPVEQEEY